MEPLLLELPEDNKEQAPSAEKEEGVFVIDFVVDYEIK
jgi:hypothetical protein